MSYITKREHILCVLNIYCIWFTLQLVIHHLIKCKHLVFKWLFLKLPIILSISIKMYHWRLKYWPDKANKYTYRVLTKTSMRSINPNAIMKTFQRIVVRKTLNFWVILVTRGVYRCCNMSRGKESGAKPMCN